MSPENCQLPTVTPSSLHRSVVTYPVNDNDELLIHQLDDPNLEKLVFYDLVKTFTIQADNWLQHHDFLPDGHIIVFDLKDISLKILPKVNIMFFKDFLVFLLVSCWFCVAFSAVNFWYD